MKMKATVEVKENEYRKVLREVLMKAYKFEWTGWRIPIYVSKDGKVYAGTSWLSQGSWQPDAIEIDNVTSWEIHEIENPTEADVYNSCESIIDYSVNNFKFDNNQYKVNLI